ncbi:hypothetical protein BH23BAC1_BH23BAC1_27430 [soil metagenome]
MKNKIIRYLQENSILISIWLILVLVFCSSIVSYIEKQTAHAYDLTNKEVAAVKKGCTLINTHVNLADMALRGFVIIEDDQLLHPFTDQVLIEYRQNYDSLYHILNHQGFDGSKIATVKETVGSYMNMISHMVDLRRQQKLEEIVNILKSDPGYDIWKVYSKFVEEVLQFEEKLAAESHEKYQKVANFSTIIQVLLFLIGFPTLCITILKIKRSTRFRQNLFASIEESNRKYIFDPDGKAKILDQKMIINDLIENLKNISLFIKGITSGDYLVDWKGLNEQNKALNKENIVGDLLNMREQMKAVRDQDERRLWITEGTSTFGEIVRKHQQDINELSFQVISGLVKYLNANQGGFFITNDTNPDDLYLELQACYAYDRQKFHHKRVEIGEGLLGQAYLEQDTLFFTEIPKAYITITSGLGEANPTCLLIVPLKFNDKIEALIEIASFNILEEHEIEFTKKVGEFVASAIASVKVNAKTKMLLENTQIQAEQMRAQEEEMRQNMEELQATQEEIQRKTLEYQEIIEANNNEMEEIKIKLAKYESLNS